MYLNRRSSRGFALAEMIISLAAVTLAIALVAGLGQQVTQLARSSKQTAAVVELRSKTTAITRNLESWIGKLRSSPHTGAVFSACIPDPSTPVSVFKCPDVNADLLNNDAELKRIAGTQLHAASVNVVDMQGEKLAGTIDDPVLYDLDGRVCTSNCALKATGFMLRSNPANDSTPGSVKFVVKVEPYSRSKNPPIKTGYLSIDVGSEWQQPTGICPSGSIKVGYLSNGKPSCINPTQKCAANTVHLGIDSSGNPICKTPPVSCATAGGNVVINAEGTDLVCAINLQTSVPCQSNEIFLGYYAGTGVPMCSSTNLSCPDGQIQIGIAQEGANLTAQCKTLPSCHDSQKISYDGSQFECVSNSIAAISCGNNQIMTGIGSNGQAVCVDRTINSTQSCSAVNGVEHYLKGFNADGSLNCAPIQNSGPENCAALNGIWNNTTQKCDLYVGQTASLQLLAASSGFLNSINGVCTDFKGEVNSSTCRSYFLSRGKDTAYRSIKDTSINSDGADSNREFLLTEQSGPNSAFSDTSSLHHVVIPSRSDYIGFGCNALEGWRLVSCTNIADGGDSDIISYKKYQNGVLAVEGCRSNDFFQFNVLMEVRCVKGLAP